jgi:hypothetical protein
MTTRPDSARSICKEVGLSLSQWQKAKDAGIHEGICKEEERRGTWKWGRGGSPLPLPYPPPPPLPPSPRGGGKESIAAQVKARFGSGAVCLCSKKFELENATGLQ